MEMTAQRLDLPDAYGTATRTLAWADVAGRLERAMHYWIATTRTDGRPHAVPKDGLWLDDALFFGGAPDTVNNRNLVADGRLSVHLGDAQEVVILEGIAAVVRADPDLAERLVTASRAKYGYAPPPETYAGGVWRMVPQRVLAWTAFPTDATRFVSDR